MIPITAERLTFYWIQADEHHAAEHLFSVDERGCIEDVITAAPGYIELRKRTVDLEVESFIETQSSADLFMHHRALVAEYPMRNEERYTIAEIVDFSQRLLAEAAANDAKGVASEVRHGLAF